MFFKTPQSFLFCCLYFFLVISLFYVSDFLVFWCVIEMSTLVFIGIGYSFLKNSFSFFLVFFIIQSLSAFLLLIFFILGWSCLFTVSFFLKLSIFPFHYWFIGLVQYFPNIVFFLISTIFNVPGFYLFTYYSDLFSVVLVIVGSLLNLAVGGVIICSTLDLRLLLMSSSVSNNSWMLIACLSSLMMFWLFLFFYSVFLWILLFSPKSLISFQLGSLSNPSSVFSVISLVSMSGLPPFPMFFVNMGVIYSLVVWGVSGVYIGLLIAVTVMLLAGYMIFFFNIFINLNSSSAIVGLL